METFSWKSPSEAHVKPWATAQETQRLLPASTGRAHVSTPTQTEKHTRNQKPKHLKMNKKNPHDLITRQLAPRAKEEIVVKPEFSPWDTDSGREECFQRLPVPGKEPGSQRQRGRTLVPSQHRLQRAPLYQHNGTPISTTGCLRCGHGAPGCTKVPTCAVDTG